MLYKSKIFESVRPDPDCATNRDPGSKLLGHFNFRAAIFIFESRQPRGVFTTRVIIVQE